MELLTKLGIDWKLLVAQLVNFVVLAGLLSSFVYKPVLRLLDDRRERVRKSMEDAKAIENQRREIETFRAEQFRKIDQECGRFLEAAKHQADASRKEILAAAEKEAAAILAKARSQMGEERERMARDIQDTLASVIVRMTEKILEREFKSADQKRLLERVREQLPSALS